MQDHEVSFFSKQIKLVQRAIQFAKTFCFICKHLKGFNFETFNMFAKANHFAKIFFFEQAFQAMKPWKIISQIILVLKMLNFSKQTVQKIELRNVSMSFMKQSVFLKQAIQTMKTPRVNS